MASGKWYWEITGAGTVYTFIGIAAVLPQDGTGERWPGRTATSYGYYNSSGNKFNNNSGSAYGASYGSAGDVIGVAFDADNRTLTFYKNGASQGTAFTSIPAGTYFPCVSTFYTSATQSTNFGQRAFAYTAPSGFKALVDTNLPAVDPAVAKGSSAMDVLTWSGNNASPRSFTGLNFSPDFIWAKCRSDSAGHSLYDTVRGTGKELESQSTQAELTNTIYGYINSFDSNGFTVVAGTEPTYGSGNINMSGRTYVGWCWDAGTSTVSNSVGSITGGSQVRANPSSGFSIINWTVGTANNVTVGHGLNVAPSFIITKNRNNTFGWACYHSGIANAQNGYIDLQTTGAFTTTSSAWNNTAPTSSVFTVGTASWWGSSTNSMIAYAFAPVSGYSNFGSYTGNSQTGTSGPFIYCGFRPRFVLIKKSDSSDNWAIFDTARDSYNRAVSLLRPNTSGSEDTGDIYNRIDILSNGFAIRVDNATYGLNTNNTFVWAAWAESPFQYARAR
jgi:hypothetical protein